MQASKPHGGCHGALLLNRGVEAGKCVNLSILRIGTRSRQLGNVYLVFDDQYLLGCVGWHIAPGLAVRHFCKKRK
jgi:hypothetical protein